MNDNKRSVSAAGVGSGTLLQLAFIVLKLCKVINWKWVWVLSPMWIGAGVALILIALLIVAIKRKWI